MAERCLSCDYLKTEWYKGNNQNSILNQFLMLNCTKRNVSVVGYDRPNESQCIYFKNKVGEQNERT